MPSLKRQMRFAALAIRDVASYARSCSRCNLHGVARSELLGVSRAAADVEFQLR